MGRILGLDETVEWEKMTIQMLRHPRVSPPCAAILVLLVSLKPVNETPFVCAFAHHQIIAFKGRYSGQSSFEPIVGRQNDSRGSRGSRGDGTAIVLEAPLPLCALYALAPIFSLRFLSMLIFSFGPSSHEAFHVASYPSR